jgi:hypothetical protein
MRVVDDEDDFHGFGVACVLAHRFDRLADPQLRPDRHVVGSHQAAGTSLRPATELGNLFGGFRIDLFELFEQRLADARRQDTEEVGALVGAHFGRNQRGGARSHAAGQQSLALFIQPRKNLGGVLGWQLDEQSCSALLIQFPNDVRDVFRMDFVEQFPDLGRVFAYEFREFGADETA